MTSTDKSLDRRQWVEPPKDTSANENWQAIAARLDAQTNEQTRTDEQTQKPKRPWALGALALCAAAAVLLFALTKNSSGTGQWVGTTLTAGNETVRAVLEDGSEVIADPSTVLVRGDNEGDDIHLHLREGRATFEVTRNEARTFVVHASDVEVRVVGTRFTVTQADPVIVRVERGAVDVRVGERTDRVRAGETWSEADAASQTLGDDTGEDVLGGVLGELVPPVSTEDSARPAVMNEREDSHERARRPARSSSEELFESAREARRSGNPREAASLYERFVREHRAHANATLAAFELGRLRMDVLDDPSGAAQAFALAARGPSPFRQDAMARRAQALGQAGQRAGCERAREAYFAAYPNGRHGPGLESACSNTQ